MPLADAVSEGASLHAFVPLAGSERWRARMAELTARMRSGTLAARAAQRRHALELTLARLSARRPATPAEQHLAALAGEAVALDAALEEEPRRHLRALIQGGLEGEGTLVPLLHLLRTAATFRARGFEVRHDGLLFGASYDLLVRREHAVAEVACEALSAEAGRPLHKGVFAALVDRVNPELQTWLAAHPGRYVLKMTLPEGLAEPGGIAALHERIAAMLATEKRHHSEADVLLKLDPLVLAGAQAAGALPERLRQQFGAEAHLAVTGDPQSGSVLVMAARTGQGNEVAAAAARHLRDAARSRLTGRQPGILSLFLDDLDGAEWRDLCVSLELEGECRRFLTTEEAKRVVAVTCATRHEMLGLPGAAPEGELRFRNPSHPAAKSPGLEPAILSSV